MPVSCPGTSGGPGPCTAYVPAPAFALTRLRARSCPSRTGSGPRGERDNGGDTNRLPGGDAARSSRREAPPGIPGPGRARAGLADGAAAPTPRAPRRTVTRRRGDVDGRDRGGSPPGLGDQATRPRASQRGPVSAHYAHVRPARPATPARPGLPSDARSAPTACPAALT